MVVAIVVIAVAVCTVVDTKCTVAFDKGLTAAEVNAFSERTDAFIHGVEVKYIGAESKSEYLSLVTYNNYEEITAAYVLTPIAKIGRLKEDESVSYVEHVFDITGKGNYEAYPSPRSRG